MALAMMVALGVWWRLASPPGLSEPMALVAILPGEFLMGSPAAEPHRRADELQHLVRITVAFKMGRFEVTQRQWREVMGTSLERQRDLAQQAQGERSSAWWRRAGADFLAAPRESWAQIWSIGPRKYLRQLGSGEVAQWPLPGVGDDYPMYFVNWTEATAFGARLTELEHAAGRLPAMAEYRLPTEAEWEYACRAGSTGLFANGEDREALAAMGWCDGPWPRSPGMPEPFSCGLSYGGARKVGTKQANAWGLSDLHGNLWEWCRDWQGPYPAGEVTDPTGPSQGTRRLARGGAWGYDPHDCRSACREGNDPGWRSAGLGFRVVVAPGAGAAIRPE